MFICEICNREFKSIQSLSGHKKVHKEDYDPFKVNSWSKQFEIILDEFEYKGNRSRIESIRRYHLTPNLCKTCETILPYDKRGSKYCSSTCAAKDTNIGKTKNIETRQKISNTLIARKIPKSLETRQKLSVAMKKYKAEQFPKTSSTNRKKTKFKQSDGSWKIICHHCGTEFVSKMNQKYCDEHRMLYKNNGRNRYAFRFNVYHYPDLFDLDLIKERGWHSHGGKFDFNPEGLTRDHKVSVYESIRNNYDPYYITHPMNCEIMSFTENDRKNTSSSISYDVLINMVEDYEKRKGAADLR